MSERAQPRPLATQPLGRTPARAVGWVLAPGELAALGRDARAHVSDADAAAWWEGLSRTDRALLLATGQRTLRERGLVDAAGDTVPELAAAFRVRRTPHHVVIASPAEGDRILLHCAADRSLCTLERTAPDRGVELLPLSRDGALSVVLAECAPAGGELTVVRVDVARSVAATAAGVAADVGTAQAGWQEYETRVAAAEGTLAEVAAAWVDAQLAPPADV